ncbi:MAG: glycosyltransferase, partial [Kovacikia sp.]
VLHPMQVFEYLPAFVGAWRTFQHRSGRNYILFQTNDWLSGWVGLQLRNQLGLPLVHSSCVIGALKYLWLETVQELSIRHSVERICLEQADCVVATNPLEVVDLCQMMPNRGQVKVVPYGIDTQHFGSLSQAIARQKLGIAPETRLILYVGRFAPLKGIEILVKACALLPKPFQLYLVNNSGGEEGDWEEQQYVRTLVKQMDVDASVVFIGQVSRSQLPSYYAAANVCVVPSYYEESGLISLESMASGTPVIAHAVGGLRYVVRHGQTGLLVPPFNLNVLATSIWDSLSNPARWRTYGLIGQRWVRSRFSYAAVSTQMYDLYQSVSLAKGMEADQRHP